MFDKLLEILLKCVPNTDTSRITMETRLKEDLGLASYDYVLIVFEIEEEFGITIPENIIFETVGDVCNYMADNIPSDKKR